MTIFNGTSTGRISGIGNTSAPSDRAITMLPKPVIASVVKARKMNNPSSSQGEASRSIRYCSSSLANLRSIKRW